jgi:plastocyanin
MNEFVTSEARDEDGDDAPITARMQRRRDTRRQLTRRALATTAGLSVAATVLGLVAVSSSNPTAKIVHLPTAKAANAAFVSGLLSSTDPVPAAAKPATAGNVQVAIQNYAFSPAALTVAVGTKVTWTNDDTAPHTVTVSSGPVKFSSPSLQKGDTYTFTFTAAGTYSYYCAVHPSMVAKVVVTGSAPPTTTPTSSAPTTSAPTSTSPTMSMPMPTPGSGAATWAVSSGWQTLLTHVDTAHLQESPGQQVNDILNVDSYIGNHLVLVEKILDPLTSGGLTNALSGLLQTLLTHVDTAHLGESPGQQVNDILDVNSYIGNHLALVNNMLGSTQSLLC